MTEWLLIETAPKDGTRVDLKDDSREVLGCHWSFCDIGPHGQMAWAWAPSDFRPTHWRPHKARSPH